MNCKAFIIFFLLAFASCQDYGNMDKKTTLSRDLAEVSGIAVYKGSPTLYVITDHANPNIIYGLDTDGNIVQQILVANASNEDWEDLTTDGKNRLFIGDFGNNDNKRRDQTIYTIKNIENYKHKKDTAYATKTTFTLADQRNYPAKLDNRNFDIEAFIYREGYFYFFTHNRERKNFDGMLKVYKIPAKEGNFKASPIASYTLCDDDINCAVTSAVLSEDGKTLLLLTYNTIYKLTRFTDDDFFGGTMKRFSLGHSSKKEAIAFKDSTTVFIADERRAQSGGNLYEYRFK